MALIDYSKGDNVAVAFFGQIAASSVSSLTFKDELKVVLPSFLRREMQGRRAVFRRGVLKILQGENCFSDAADFFSDEKHLFFLSEKKSVQIIRKKEVE